MRKGPKEKHGSSKNARARAISRPEIAGEQCTSKDRSTLRRVCNMNDCTRGFLSLCDVWLVYDLRVALFRFRGKFCFWHFYANCVDLRFFGDVFFVTFFVNL